MNQTLPSPLLLTGAAGFIGSAFARSCNQKGIPLISVDSLSHFQDRPEHQNIDFGTLIDRDELFEKLPHLAFSAIVHLGACASTLEMNEAFLHRVNVEYSQKLWTFAAEKKLPMIYASSAATYGNGDQGYKDDETRLADLKPLNPYGRSKWLFDVWALEEEKKGQHPPTWGGFKFFNVYGFGERHKKNMASVVLHSFDQILSTSGMKLFKSHKQGIADGHQSRDFIYVGDVVNVLHFALSHPIRRGIFNLGSGKARPFLDLVRTVFQTLGKPEKIEFIDTPISIRDKYQYFTEASMDRLRSEGYTLPFTSLEEGVAVYVNQLQDQETSS